MIGKHSRGPDAEELAAVLVALVKAGPASAQTQAQVLARTGAQARSGPEPAGWRRPERTRSFSGPLSWAAGTEVSGRGAW